MRMRYRGGPGRLSAPHSGEAEEESGGRAGAGGRDGEPPRIPVSRAVQTSQPPPLIAEVPIFISRRHTERVSSFIDCLSVWKYSRIKVLFGGFVYQLSIPL